MMDGSTFTNAERTMLNGMAAGREVASMSHNKCLEILHFMMQTCDETAANTLEELIAKIEGISDADWKFLRLLMPFEVFAEPDMNEET